MFVLFQSQYNKSGIMSALAGIMKEKKELDGGPSRSFDWIDKNGVHRLAHLSDITRGQALSYLWASARKLIESNDKRIDDILDNYVEKRKKQMKEETKKVEANMIDTVDIIERAWSDYKLLCGRKEFTWKEFIFYLRREVKIAKTVNAMHDDMSVADIKNMEIKEEECIRYLEKVDSKTHTFYSLCKLHYNLKYFVKSKWFAQEFKSAYAGVMRRIEEKEEE